MKTWMVWSGFGFVLVGEEDLTSLGKDLASVGTVQ